MVDRQMSSRRGSADPVLRDRPCVIYLAGSGRSGSTLLERSLGGIPGFVNVGELIDLFRRVATLNERCGCGERFTECPFWSAVGERAFGGWTPDSVARVGRLQLRVARQRHLPQLTGLYRTGSFAVDTESYQAAYTRLYRAILDESGARYVVDASKWPAQALALSGDQIDLRVVHVVREIHGVVHSMGKQNVPRPHATLGRATMARSGAAGAAAKWVACQVEAELVRYRGPLFATVRYEQLVREPRSTIETALSELKIAPINNSLDHIGPHNVRLAKSHGLAGNPSRFTEGDVSLRLDEEWQSSMPLRRQRLVSAIGAAYSLPQFIFHRSGATGNRSATTSISQQKGRP